MTLTMRPEIRDLWADALESGEYRQTKGVLAQVEHQDGEYVITGACCLGVLSDLAVKAGAIPQPTVLGNEASNGYGDVFEYGDEGDSSFTGLPMEVARWAGLFDEDGDRPSDPVLTNANGTRRGAAGWNDDQEATFAEIAVMVRAIPAPVAVSV
jgi:hypothetical protein